MIPDFFPGESKTTAWVLHPTKVPEFHASIPASDLSPEALRAILGEPLPKTVPLTPKRILRSGIATIVFWEDGSKTVVKRSPDEPDNEYAAFTAALAIRIFGSNSKVKKVIKTKTEEQKSKPVEEEK